MTTNAETHHYIKNILQSLISFINTAGMNKNAQPAEVVAKLQAFIHIQSSIQDFVFDSKQLDYKADIRTDLVIEKVISTQSGLVNINKNDFPALLCSVKRTANLALIFLESLHFLKKCTSQDISVEIDDLESGEYEIKMTAFLRDDLLIVLDKAADNDLKLASLLMKSDLKSELKLSNAENKLVISSVFALQ